MIHGILKYISYVHSISSREMKGSASKNPECSHVIAQPFRSYRSANAVSYQLTNPRRRNFVTRNRKNDGGVSSGPFQMLLLVATCLRCVDKKCLRALSGCHPDYVALDPSQPRPFEAMTLLMWLVPIALHHFQALTRLGRRCWRCRSSHRSQAGGKRRYLDALDREAWRCGDRDK